MRTRKGRFAAGYSGNPGGRPAMPREVRIRARGNTLDALLVLREVMLSAKAAPAARVQAAAVRLKFAWGGAPLDTDGGNDAHDGWDLDSGEQQGALPELGEAPSLARVLRAIADLEPDLRARFGIQVNVGDKQVNVVAPIGPPESSR